MIEPVHLTFYRISQCGYFKRSRDSAEFGNLDETLRDIGGWVTEKQFGSTATFSPDTNDDVTQIYCLSLDFDDSHDCLLSLWNATSGKGEAVRSVAAAAIVGKATVSTHPISSDQITGFPTHYWFIPSLHVVATVRLSDAKNNQNGMTRYIQGFLSTVSPHVIKDDGDGDSDIISRGYRNKPDDDPIDVHPRFSSRIVSNPTKLEEIRSAYRNIRQLVRREAIPNELALKKDGISAILKYFRLSQPSSEQDEIKIKFQVAYRPTKAQVNEIIRLWEESESHSKFDDVGFMMKGKSSPIWLSRSYERETISIDVKRKSTGDVDLKSLLASLSKFKSKFATQLKMP